MPRSSLFVYLLVLSIAVLAYNCRNFIKYLFNFKSAGKWKNNIDGFDEDIAFFHPFCDDCGGGERVLWFFILSIQQRWPNSRIYIYKCTKSDPKGIIQKAQSRFGIKLNEENISFVQLNGEKWILPKTYPFMTMTFQALGSIFVGLEAYASLRPSIFIDTTGFSFIPWIFKVGGCKTVSYVHYPTISTDMIKSVKNRTVSYNNSQFIGKNAAFSYLKLIYYYLYSVAYKISGKFIDLALVNSKWTYCHISELWNVRGENCVLVYPPCSPHVFSDYSERSRNKYILSISQFRPEKNQKLQIQVMEKLVSLLNDTQKRGLKLVIAGSLRGEKDELLFEDLRRYSEQLQLQDYVSFELNLPFFELKNKMQNSLIGIHTMDREHFGIGIVEMMAAGLIVVAHNSGGPQSDIIVPYNNNTVGFLAESVDDYANTIRKILDLDNDSMMNIKRNSKEYVNTHFSDNNFIKTIISVMEKVVLNP